MFQIINSKPKDICVAHRCKNKKADRDRFCHKHRKRYQKETNPISYHYNMLRSNARRRGKEFTITKEDFAEFCEETNYLELKGKSKDSASIDRIDPSKGYIKGNLQILTLGQNSAKRWEDEMDECPF